MVLTTAQDDGCYGGEGDPSQSPCIAVFFTIDYEWNPLLILHTTAQDDGFYEHINNQILSSELMKSH